MIKKEKFNESKFHYGMTSITKATNLKGKKVLIRVDYNVPLRGKKILDTRRIESSYRTIDTVLKKGGVPILLAHLGDGRESLKPVAAFLSKKYKVLFLAGPIEGEAREWVLKHATKGAVILLENIRRNPGEENNDPAFAKLLASLGDAYVNDAFSVSHRAHASIVGLPKLLPAFAGVQLEAELTALDGVLAAKDHPFLFILGGAKFSTKIPLIERFADKADGIVIAGAILNNFYRAAGFEVGKSVIEKGYDEAIARIMKNPNMLLPTDVVVAGREKRCIVGPDEVKKGDKIVDIGPESIAQIIAKIKKAKLVVWNGPTGWYEGGYGKGTVSLAKAILDSKAKAVIGGGDTAAVLEKMLKKTPANKRVFISTGGGATLDYLAKGTLPGVHSLERKS